MRINISLLESKPIIQAIKELEMVTEENVKGFNLYYAADRFCLAGKVLVN